MTLMQSFIIYFVGLVLGVFLGHHQAEVWAEKRESALKVQIESQDCSEGNPYQGKERRFYDSPGNSKGP